MLTRVFLSGFVAISLFAQSQAPAPQASATAPQPEPPHIKVSVNEVIVPITVTDEKGRFVSDLEQKDFQIMDEGKEQKIEFFTRERSQPVVVGFLIDMSNASRLHWKNYKDAAVELVQNLIPGDNPKYSGYLIAYANDAELLVNTTSDPEPMVAEDGQVEAQRRLGVSTTRSTLACTNRKLIKGEPIEPRRVLVIIGDGHDNSSKKTIDEALEIAQRNLVTIYGVSTVAFGFDNLDDKNLVRLAEETGGRVEYPLEGVYSDVSGYLSQPSDDGNYALKVGTGAYTSQLANGMYRAIEAVAGEITTQYIIRYIPDAVDAKHPFRNIVVRVNLANVKVRARKGYYPFAP